MLNLGKVEAIFRQIARELKVVSRCCILLKAAHARQIVKEGNSHKVKCMHRGFQSHKDTPGVKK